jgi:uncharacterized membrane protein YsdA (DUF1294 family)
MTADATSTARGHGRGVVWWVGVAAQVVIAVVVALVIWSLLATSVSKSDRRAASRAVERIAHVSGATSACIGPGTVACIVQFKKNGRCQEWSVQVKNGQAVSRPRWLATTAC